MRIVEPAHVLAAFFGHKAAAHEIRGEVLEINSVAKAARHSSRGPQAGFIETLIRS